jgi:hypothetical protein
VNRLALRVENWEAEQLRSCLSAMETALATIDREMAVAEAAAG